MQLVVVSRWLVTWENEGGTSWVKYFSKADGGVPAGLDIISLDDYYMGAHAHATDPGAVQADMRNLSGCTASDIAHRSTVAT